MTVAFFWLGASFAVLPVVSFFLPGDTKEIVCVVPFMFLVMPAVHHYIED
jgi:hypothetical protein